MKSKKTLGMRYHEEKPDAMKSKKTFGTRYHIKEPEVNESQDTFTAEDQDELPLFFSGQLEQAEQHFKPLAYTEPMKTPTEMIEPPPSQGVEGNEFNDSHQDLHVTDQDLFEHATVGKDDTQLGDGSPVRLDRPQRDRC